MLYPNALLFQTVSSEAQEILSRSDEIAGEVARQLIPFDDWQVIHRLVLQLGRALGGRRQILEVTLPKESLMAAIDPEPQSLSTRQLVTRLLETVSLLVTKEIELARAELKADLKAELDMVKLLVAAGMVAMFGVNMLLVSAVFALTGWVPGWLAALGIAVLLLAIGAVFALFGWNRRVSAPLAVTRKTVQEDVQWAKERLA